ncbi:hypothetical protein ACJX0J_026604 [Zea mays]
MCNLEIYAMFFMTIELFIQIKCVTLNFMDHFSMSFILYFKLFFATIQIPNTFEYY